MITDDQRAGWRALLTRRVTIILDDDAAFVGRLTGIAPDGSVFVRAAEPPYDERRMANVARIDAAPLTCVEGHEAETLTRAGRCADHERDAAAREVAVTESCDHCGHPGAFRSPRDRRNVYLCVGCHAEAGSLSGLGPEARLLEAQDPVRGAVCRGADVDDTRHVWVRVKGHRHVCRTCQRHRFTDPT